MFGQTVVDIIKEELNYALEAFKHLRGQANSFSSMENPSSFDTGGYTGNFSGGKLAVLHEKERVLTAQQTAAFEKLVDYVLPNISAMPQTKINDASGNLGSTVINSGNIEFNNTYNVVSNTDFDAKRFEQNVEKKMKKELLSAGKRIL